MSIVELLYYKFLCLFKKAKKPYVLAGGRKGILTLVTRFYELMDLGPESELVRQMHQDDLTQSRQKLFMFLSGWFGGPNLYWREFGHPRMRARHMKFPINSIARDQWLYCMQMAINEMSWKQEFKEFTMKSFTDFAHHMQNRN